MGQLTVIHDSCDRCGVTFPESDNFCRNCGLPAKGTCALVLDAELIESHHDAVVTPPIQSALAPFREQSLITEVLGNRACVIAILLCVGPIGLPALWFSHRFSRLSKIITTTGFFLFTAVLPLVIAWYCLDIAVLPILDAFQQ